MAKPYYQDKWVTIYHGDCREILPELPKVDLVLTDLPYGVGEVYTSYQDTLENLKELIKVTLPLMLSKASITAITCGVPNILLYPKPTWILARVYPAGYGSTPWGFDCWTPILVYGGDPYLKNRMGRRPNIILDNTQSAISEEGRQHNKAKEEHPCVKPLEFWKNLLVRCSVKTSDIILDPFLGVGTTVVAAKQLNRTSIGIEIGEKYCEIAANRCRQSVMEF